MNTEILEKGGLEPIVELLDSPHPNIQLLAAKALAVMISHGMHLAVDDGALLSTR